MAMKKIMMNKYGFIRWPEEDFSDDGNRFYAYKVGTRVRVTKLISDGTAFIDGTILNGKLPYSVYSQLPHYRAISNLNGVSLSSLTEEDLQKLYTDCLTYELEYTAEENSIVYPSIAELEEQCKKIHSKAIVELNHVEQLFSQKSVEAACKLSDYEWKYLRDYIVILYKRAEKYNSDAKITDRAIELYQTSYSFQFCSSTSSELLDSYYYREIIKLLNRV